MPNTGRKNGAGVRIAPPNTRKPKNKDSNGEDGETPPGSEAGAVDQDDADAEEHTAPIDLASFQKQFSTMQKQLAHMMQHMPSTKTRASTESRDTFGVKICRPSGRRFRDQRPSQARADASDHTSVSALGCVSQ